MKSKMLNLPFNNGQSLPKAPIGPRVVSCPISNSIYRSGIPQTNKAKMYGTRKAPKRKRKKKTYFNSAKKF